MRSATRFSGNDVIINGHVSIIGQLVRTFCLLVLNRSTRTAAAAATIAAAAAVANSPRATNTTHLFSPPLWNTYSHTPIPINYERVHQLYLRAHTIFDTLTYRSHRCRALLANHVLPTSVRGYVYTSIS